MVPSIARQSIIIKCNMQKSVITGNYEYYYAAGLMSPLWGITLSEEMKPLEVAEQIAGKAEQIETKDEKEAWLLHMLKDYAPTEEYDEQMAELFRLGVNEEYLWMVTIPS